jgi:DNA repair exonuclease SbcCD nuclease subunit
MKIAITADVHLKTESSSPERFNALRDVLNQVVKENIGIVIIAGDLFDMESRNYSLFDSICKDKKYSGLNFHIIPGNHDQLVSNKYFTADNITVYTEPKLVFLEEGGPGFFFIPYVAGGSIGEVLAKDRSSLSGRWLLVGHGDYLSGTKNPNSYESGMYMPLGRSDIEYYNPARVILGHIHKKMQSGKVRYPGSPCGMDINETGKRSFMVLDTNDLSFTEKTVNTDYIYFSESLLAVPVADEFEYIKKKIASMIESWDLKAEEAPMARIRISVSGYCSDLKLLQSTISQSLLNYKFYNDEGPDFSGVSVFDEPERVSIVERVRKKVEAEAEGAQLSSEKKDRILESAIGLVING